MLGWKGNSHVFLYYFYVFWSPIVVLGFKHVEVHKLQLRIIVNPEEIEFLDFVQMSPILKRFKIYEDHGGKNTL